MKGFKQLFDEVRRRRKERERAAGKHKCRWQKAGHIAQVTSGKKILKRPKVVASFYECAVCGKPKP